VPLVRRIAVVLPLGVLAQAVIGGITVLTGLRWWTVSVHFLASMVLIALAVIALHALRANPSEPAAPRGLRHALTAIAAIGFVVLLLGTFVTAAGPHGGDASAPRIGIDIRLLAIAHADAVWLLLGAIVAAEGETVGVNALLATLTAGAGAAPVAAPAAAAAKAETGGAAVAVMVPTLGESVSEATVSTWFKKVGDTVAQDEMLCELETDKVSVEVPSPAAGVLTEILAPEGTTVQATGQLAVIGGSAGATAAASPTPAPAAAPAATGKDVEHAPSAQKLMAEKGLSPAQVQGTGRDGRIMKEDVMKAATAPAAPPPFRASPGRRSRLTSAPRRPGLPQTLMASPRPPPAAPQWTCLAT
jgi:biotin carboxyl carrier protein